MNHTFSKNKRLIAYGIVFAISLTAFKFISGNSINTNSRNTQSAGLNPRVDYTVQEPCVADEFRNHLPENASYEPIKWSKATAYTLRGADSVIVHGYRLVDENGTSTIFTKLIYFDENCDVVFIE